MPLIEYVRHPRLAERYGQVQDPEEMDLEEGHRETGSDYFREVIGKIDKHRLYRTREAASFLGCSVRYVQVLVERGRLEALQGGAGQMIRIPGQGLIHFIDKARKDRG